MEMRYLAQGLAHAGHTVHVPQLAGHCAGGDELRGHHLVRLVPGAWKRSMVGSKRGAIAIVVGGLSMGAILAIHHAAMHPNAVSALTLYAHDAMAREVGCALVRRPLQACENEMVRRLLCLR